MPTVVQVTVWGARELPVMNQRSKSADAYVEVEVGSGKQRTRVVRRSLDPEWNESFRFEEMDDSILQDEPARFVVMDKDTYSADDEIGSVTIDLNALLARAARHPTAQITGWFPVLDSLRGLCGRLLVSVEMRTWEDANKFDESSARVRFFACSSLQPSSSLVVRRVVGLVDELLVEEDPDYSFGDNFRTARAANAKRLAQLHRLAANLRRQIGLHDKPVVILDCAGYWQPLKALLDQVVSQGFAPHSSHELYHFADSVLELFDILEAAPEPTISAPTERF